MDSSAGTFYCIFTGKFCSQKLALENIVSSWHHLHVVFVPNAATSEMGFYAQYKINQYESDFNPSENKSKSTVQISHLTRTHTYQHTPARTYAHTHAYTHKHTSCLYFYLTVTSVKSCRDGRSFADTRFEAVFLKIFFI